MLIGAIAQAAIAKADEWARESRNAATAIVTSATSAIRAQSTQIGTVLPEITKLVGNNSVCSTFIQVKVQPT